MAPRSDPALEAYLDARPASPLRELFASPNAAALGLEGLPREILQQPWLYDETRRRVLGSAEILDFVRPTVQEGARWVLCGAGSSNFLGEAIAPWLARCLEQEVEAYPSTDLLARPEGLRARSSEPTLFLHFSRSGGTAEAIAGFELAHEIAPGARHLAITCNEESELARIARRHPESARALILHPASHDLGLAMTSSVTSMMVAGLSLGQLGAGAPSDASFEHRIDAAARSLEQLLEEHASLARELAIADPTRVCALGTGALRATASEACLKITELVDGAIASFSDTFLGVRHGPLSAVNERTLVLASVATAAQRRAYEIDFLNELEAKALGARLVATTSELPREASEGIDWVALETSADGAPICDDLRPLVDVGIAQMVGLFASLHHGLTPDRPSRRGAIQRVVAGFRLHPRPEGQGADSRDWIPRALRQASPKTKPAPRGLPRERA